MLYKDAPEVEAEISEKAKNYIMSKIEIVKNGPINRSDLAFQVSTMIEMAYEIGIIAEDEQVVLYDLLNEARDLVD